MKKFIISTMVILSLGLSGLSADVGKGQKIYSKFYKTECGINGSELSAKHTQDEWADGNLTLMINRSCENNLTIKDKHLNHLKDFLIEYASDSGNVPSC